MHEAVVLGNEGLAEAIPDRVVPLEDVVLNFRREYFVGHTRRADRAVGFNSLFVAQIEALQDVIIGWLTIELETKHTLKTIMQILWQSLEQLQGILLLQAF